MAPLWLVDVNMAFFDSNSMARDAMCCPNGGMCSGKFHCLVQLQPTNSIITSSSVRRQTMDRPESPDMLAIGADCNAADCRQHDFLPFKCDACHQVLNYIYYYLMSLHLYGTA